MYFLFTAYHQYTCHFPYSEIRQPETKELMLNGRLFPTKKPDADRHYQSYFRRIKWPCFIEMMRRFAGFILIRSVAVRGCTGQVANMFL